MVNRFGHIDRSDIHIDRPDIHIDRPNPIGSVNMRGIYYTNINNTNNNTTTKEKSSVSYETKEREEREDTSSVVLKDTSSVVLDTSSVVLDTKDPADFSTLKDTIKGQITKLFDVIEKDSSLSVK